jgi:hypothetical protein
MGKRIGSSRALCASLCAKYASWVSVLLLFAVPANATLGEGESSIASDQSAIAAITGAAVSVVPLSSAQISKMKRGSLPGSAAKSTSASTDRYTIQEIQSGAHAVREYVSSSGVVFGLAWTGMRHPNLAPLLGSYYDSYRAALKQHGRVHGKRRLSLKANRLVVQTWGHMRRLQGRAYDPALLPEGVRPDEIR